MQSTLRNDIHTAIHSIYEKVGYVLKQGSINFGNTKYKYAGEADLIAALRPAMVEAGITVSVNNMELVHQSPGHVIVKCLYVFNHKASNTDLNVTSMGEGKDSGDKAVPKALTGAYKYALRQTFMIETGDDPDKLSSEELVHEEKKQTAASLKKLWQEIWDEFEEAGDLDKLQAAKVSRKDDLAKLKSQYDREAIIKLGDLYKDQELKFNSPERK